MGCDTPPFAAPLWRSLLRTELEGDGVEELRFEGEASDALAVIRVELARCGADATALTLTIDDAVTRKSVRRGVELGDVAPGGRARALALAVAELLRASWAELGLSTASDASARPAPRVREAMLVRLVDSLRRGGALAAPTRPAATRSARWGLGLSVAVLTFPAANAALLGGRASVSLAPVRAWPLRLRLDAGLHVGTAFDPLGEIDLGIATAGIATTLHAGGERVALELGPRIEFGWSWVAGRPSVAGARAGEGDAAVFFASVLASLRVRVSPRWWTALDAVAGTALRSVIIESGMARAAGFTGPMLSLGLGVVVTL